MLIPLSIHTSMHDASVEAVTPVTGLSLHYVHCIRNPHVHLIKAQLEGIGCTGRQAPGIRD